MFGDYILTLAFNTVVSNFITLIIVWNISNILFAPRSAMCSRRSKRFENTRRSHWIPINVRQCDAIRWEQLENWHSWRGYNFWTNDLIWVLKTPTRLYSCLAKFMPKTCLNVSFISCRLMKSVRFRIVPIWLLHTVLTGSLVEPIEFRAVHRLYRYTVKIEWSDWTVCQYKEGRIFRFTV